MRHFFLLCQHINRPGVRLALGLAAIAFATIMLPKRVAEAPQAAQAFSATSEPIARADHPGDKPAAPAPSLEGIWLAQSGHFSGACIIRKFGDTYALSYAMGSTEGGTLYQSHTPGTGMWAGNALSVGWKQVDGSFGVSVYTLTETKTSKVLSGQWAVFPGGTLKSERLLFLKALPRIPGDV